MIRTFGGPWIDIPVSGRATRTFIRLVSRKSEKLLFKLVYRVKYWQLSFHCLGPLKTSLTSFSKNLTYRNQAVVCGAAAG